ncbi:MAG: hypothetical protein INR66_22660 [Gordonia polyisoprenivorans]|nr:hypothetical protein [Gordonia polyisoprenivorans]
MHATLRATITAIVAVLMLAGCVAGGTNMHEDAAGLTQADIADRSLHEEYDTYRDRYEHMQALLKDAQLQVHDGEWEWNNGDRIPGGGHGIAPLSGSDTKNTYDLSTSRLWSPPGATGAKRDLDPMIDYFTDQGWNVSERTIGDLHDVSGVTGDGWQLIYSIDTNGRYALDVYSELFWTNDGDGLSEAISSRNDGEYPAQSLPGVYPPFPGWDAPIVNPPKI